MMSRSTTARSNSERPRPVHGGSDSPPWEEACTVQVPYMKSSSADRDVLPSLWTTTSNQRPTTTIRPALDSRTQSDETDYCSPSTPQTNSLPPWKRNAARSVSPPARMPAPYETQLHYPSRAYSDEQPSTYTRRPPGPRSTRTTPPRPDKAYDNRCHDPNSSSAMAGTMSSRKGRGTRPTTRSRSATRKGAADAERKRPLAQRVRTAFRDMFTRDPVDESQLERIEDRHWTDE